MGRIFDWYLCTGMGLFTVAAVFGEHPKEKIMYEEFAHFDPAMVTDGEIRGTIRYTTNQECVSRARQKFHYEWIDIVGQRDLPADGISAPYVWGCRRVDVLTGKRRNEVFR